MHCVHRNRGHFLLDLLEANLESAKAVTTATTHAGAAAQPTKKRPATKPSALGLAELLDNARPATDQSRVKNRPNPSQPHDLDPSARHETINARAPSPSLPSPATRPFLSVVSSSSSGTRQNFAPEREGETNSLFRPPDSPPPPEEGGRSQPKSQRKTGPRRARPSGGAGYGRQVRRGHQPSRAARSWPSIYTPPPPAAPTTAPGPPLQLQGPSPSVFPTHLGGWAPAIT